MAAIKQSLQKIETYLSIATDSYIQPLAVIYDNRIDLLNERSEETICSWVMVGLI